MRSSAPTFTDWRKSSRSTNASNCVEVAWRKSSYSSNASNCVEIAWRKSSRSGGTNCVEAALADAAAVRDSKNTTGPILTFPVTAWSAFLAAVD